MEWNCRVTNRSCSLYNCLSWYMKYSNVYGILYTIICIVLCIVLEHVVFMLETTSAFVVFFPNYLLFVTKGSMGSRRFCFQCRAFQRKHQFGSSSYNLKSPKMSSKTPKLKNYLKFVEHQNKKTEDFLQVYERNVPWNIGHSLRFDPPWEAQGFHSFSFRSAIGEGQHRVLTTIAPGEFPSCCFQTKICIAVS